MRKEDLMALRRAEELDLLQTMLVDIADGMYKVQYDRIALRQTMEMVAEALELRLSYLTDLINPNTPKRSINSAITATRLSKVPNTVVIVADELHDVTNWVKTYTAKDIVTYVYHVDTERFYTDVEYMTWFGPEHILDFVMLMRHSEDREFLEDLAESFGAALGWSFSGPIRDRSISVDFFDKFKPYEKMPYAGWKGNYGFANTVHKLGETFIEDDATQLSGKVTITPSLNTRNMVGRAVSNAELTAFRDYTLSLIEYNLLEESLEDGWAMCECGHPVRKWGNTHDDAYCLYCDRPIKDFEATVFDDDAYDRYYAKCNLDQWENIEGDDDDNYVIVVDLDDIKKYKLTDNDILRIQAFAGPDHFRFDNTHK